MPMAPGMTIHLWPSVARWLLRPTRGLGSAPLPRRRHRRRVAPSYLALLRVEFARFTPTADRGRPPASSLWHWSSPHGGRALPATLRWGARTFLAPRPGEPGRGSRSSDRLAGRGNLHPSAQRSGRRTTSAGPPAATRSMASLARASAAWFSRRGTWPAVQRSRPPSVRRADVQSGINFTSLTRQRPVSCSTMSFESSSRCTSRAPRSRASSRARTTPVYSATLLVWTPRYSEIVASGTAASSRASARRRSYRTAPSDAGPGLPRAAPSVRMTNPRRVAWSEGAGSSAHGRRGWLRSVAPRWPGSPPGSPA